MPIVESIATGITILGAAKSTFDWLTGNSVAKKVDHLSGQVERLSQNIYYNPHQEVIDLSVSNQQVISDLRDIKNAAKPIQRALGKDLVVSTPIVSPQRLKQTFNRNPEDVLFNISALTGQGMPAAHLDDPTLVPVTFTRWGQAFVGYIKIGYARDYLDLEYSPDRSLYLPSTASPAAEVHSATSHAEPSDSATWSKVVRIIAENLGVDEDEVSPGSRLVADLSADSLDMVELVMAFEEEFGIEVPDVDAERMVTAGDIYNYIVNR